MTPYEARKALKRAGWRERRLMQIERAVNDLQVRISRLISPSRYGYEPVQSSKPKGEVAQRVVELREQIDALLACGDKLIEENTPVYDAMQRLPVRTQKVLRAMYLYQRHQGQVAKMLGVSRRTVARIAAHGVRVFAERMERMTESEV